MTNNKKPVKNPRIRMFMKSGMEDEYRDIKSFQLINLTKLLNAKKNNNSMKNMNFTHKNASGKVKKDRIELTGPNTGIYILGAKNNKPEVKSDFIWMILPSHNGIMTKEEQKAEKNRRNKGKNPVKSVKNSVKKSVKNSVKKSVKNSVKKTVKNSVKKTSNNNLS